MNYAELLARVQNWIHRTDLTALMPVFVENAEARFNRDLRVRQMEGAMAATAINASGAITLPDDFQAFRRVWVSGRPELTIDPQTLDYVKSYGTTGATPTLYALSRGEAVFNGAGTVEATLYESIPGLQESTTNWLSIAHPDLYLHATIAAACEYTLDAQQGAMSDAKAQMLIDKLNRMDHRDRYSGTLTARKG